MAKNTEIPVNIISTVVAKIPSNNASTGDLYFTTDTHDIYRGNGAGATYSYTKISVTGTGPALNNYDPNTKTFTRRNLTTADISTGLGYTPANNSDLSKYLLLSGGTITGNLTVSAVSTSEITATHILKAKNGTDLILSADGDITKGYIVTESGFSPTSTNIASSLGESTYPWKDAYITNMHGTADKAETILNTKGTAYIKAWLGTIDEYIELSEHDTGTMYVFSDAIDVINAFNVHKDTYASTNGIGHVKSGDEIIVNLDGTMSVKKISESVVASALPRILSGGTF